jgi:phosphoglycerate kinase
MNVLTLKDISVSGKRVLLRIDVNAPCDEKTKKISDNDRIKSHSETIKYLASKKSKLVIIAHQGRKGGPDFTDLSQHAKLLQKHSGKKIKFVKDIYGELALNKIKSLKPGEVLLLDNVRGLDEETAKVGIEEHAKSQLATKLSPLFDYFIQDGFSVCHRAQASVVGIAYNIKSAAGLVLEKELSALEKIDPSQKATYVLGGAKPEEDIVVLKHALKNKDNIVLTG